jgi:hypothetical protein
VALSQSSGASASSRSASLVVRGSAPDTPEGSSSRSASLEVPRAEGLALLEWLGLGRPEFGAIGARDLAPRCRRRLWDVRRNAHAVLRQRTRELLAVAERAGDGMVLFG